MYPPGTILDRNGQPLPTSGPEEPVPPEGPGELPKVPGINLIFPSNEQLNVAQGMAATEQAKRIAKELADPSSALYQGIAGGSKGALLQAQEAIASERLSAAGTRATAAQRSEVQKFADFMQAEIDDIQMRSGLLGQISMFVDAEHGDMQQLVDRLVQAQQFDAARVTQTTGARAAALNFGTGAVSPGGVGVRRSFDDGGVVQGSGLAFVHDQEYVEKPAERAQIDQLLSAVQQLVARGASGGLPQLVQHFNGAGLDQVADIAAREAQRVLRAYDENKATGRPAFSGMRSG